MKRSIFFTSNGPKVPGTQFWTDTIYIIILFSLTAFFILGNHRLALFPGILIFFTAAILLYLHEIKKESIYLSGIFSQVFLFFLIVPIGVWTKFTLLLSFLPALLIYLFLFKDKRFVFPIALLAVVFLVLLNSVLKYFSFFSESFVEISLNSLDFGNPVSFGTIYTRTNPELNSQIPLAQISPMEISGLYLLAFLSFVWIIRWETLVLFGIMFMSFALPYGHKFPDFITKIASETLIWWVIYIGPMRSFHAGFPASFLSGLVVLAISFLVFIMNWNGIPVITSILIFFLLESLLLITFTEKNFSNRESVGKVVK